MKAVRLLISLLLVAISAATQAQSVTAYGPTDVCAGSVATFSSTIDLGDNTPIDTTWSIPNATFLSSSSGRTVSVAFNTAGTYTAQLTVRYSKRGQIYSVTGTATATVVSNCSLNDCSGTKASSPFLFEDFGTLPTDTGRTSLPAGYTSYVYKSWGSLADSNYMVSASPHNSNSDWVNYHDHTGNTNGGMMVVNARFTPDTFYQRTITGLCQGMNYSFSAYLMNVNTQSTYENICGSGYKFANVGFQILDAKTGAVLGSDTTHQISMDIASPLWQRFGTGFKSPNTVDSVKLVMYNLAPGGCGNDLALDDITFTYCGPQLSAYIDSASKTADTVCAGRSVTMTAEYSPSNYFNTPEYQWQYSTDLVNWNNISGAKSPTYTIDTTNTSLSQYYRFVVSEKGSISNSNCNSPSNVISLLVLKSPTVTPPDTTICLGDSVSLVSQAGYSSYLWNTGATTNVIRVAPSKSTNYWVTATLTTPNLGSCTATDTGTVTVFNSAKVNLGPDTSLCAGDTLLLNAGAEGGTYLWSNGDTTKTIQITKSGTYWVKASHISCSGSDTIVVTFNTPPSLSLGNDTTLCLGTFMTLNGPSGMNAYLWNDSSTKQSLTAAKPGTYWLQVTQGACKVRDSLNIAYDSVALRSVLSASLCGPGSVSLKATSDSSAVKFQWYTAASGGTLVYESVVNTFATPVLSDTTIYFVDALDTVKACPSLRKPDTAYINPRPTLRTLNPSPVCAPGTVNLTAAGITTGSSPNLSFSYFSDTTASSLLTRPDSVVQSGIYYLRGTNTYGCSSTAAVSVVRHDLPLISLSGSSREVCQGSSIDLSASGGLSYYWTGPSGFSMTGRSAALSNAQEQNSGLYIVHATDSNGCSRSDSLYLSVDLPPVSGLPSDTAACAGTLLKLNAELQSGTSYLWNTGDTSRSLTVSQPGTYQVSLSKGSCKVHENIRVRFDPPIHLDLGQDTMLLAGTQYALMAPSGMDRYLWSTGDTSQSITVTSPGTYQLQTSRGTCRAKAAVQIGYYSMPAINLGGDTTICSTSSLVLRTSPSDASKQWSTGSAADSIVVSKPGVYWIKEQLYGTQVTDSIRVTFDAPPTLHLGPDTFLCQGSKLNLDAGAGGDQYVWNTQATTPSIQVDSSGDYWVIKRHGVCIALDTVHVQVLQPPEVNLGTDTTICQSAPITLNAQNPDSRYLWNTGDTTSSIQADSSGTYWVQVSNPACRVRDSMHLNVDPALSLHLGDDTTICRGTSLKLDAYNPGAMYLWNTGDTSASILANRQQAYSVMVLRGTCLATDTLQLQLNPPPNVSLKRDTSMCAGGTLTLSAGGEAGTQYRWNNGSLAPTLEVNQPGTYWVLASYGVCLARDTVQVSVRKTPPVQFNQSYSTCPGDSLVLRPAPLDARYLWSNGSSADSMVVTAPGTYWVTASDRLCGTRSSDTVQVGRRPAPQISLGRDTSICAGEKLKLQPVGEPGVLYRWQDGSLNPSYTVSLPGQYTVQVANNCGVSEASIRVDTSNCSFKGDSYAPNAFSPNSDGYNDVFKPRFFVTVHDYTLMIYNRWGQLLFRSKDPEVGWDGTFNGTPCDLGGYVYLMSYRIGNIPRKIFKKGAFTLLR